MKKAFLAYNPYSGEGEFVSKLDRVIEIFQNSGWQLTLHRITDREKMFSTFEKLQEERFDYILAAGGDGTVHHVINALKKWDLNLPLGIIPAGTANDLACHLGLSPNIEKCCEMLINSSVQTMDLGVANDLYFINVASAGVLTDVAYNTSIKFKQIAGKLAYYFKGLEQIPSLRPVPMVIQVGEIKIEEEILLFLILNGSAAGGFTSLAPGAKIDDGKLDLLIFKDCTFTELINLFIMLLRGEHIRSKKLTYIQTEKTIKIQCPNDIPTDLDGEPGPRFPLTITMAKNSQKILVPSQGG